MTHRRFAAVVVLAALWPHGGDVEVDDAPGGGALFKLRFRRT